MNRKLIGSMFLAGLLTLAAASRTAYADTFDMAWTGGYGPGSAVLTATADGGGVYTATSLTGMQDGLSITLVPIGVYGSNDNEIFESPNPDLVDFAGFAFTDGTNDYNIFLWTLPNETNTYTECSSAVTGLNGCEQAPDFDISPAIDTLSIVDVSSPTPEPGSLVLLGSGAVLGLTQLRRRFLRF